MRHIWCPLVLDRGSSTFLLLWPPPRYEHLDYFHGPVWGLFCCCCCCFISKSLRPNGQRDHSPVPVRGPSGMRTAVVDHRCIDMHPNQLLQMKPPHLLHLYPPHGDARPSSPVLSPGSACVLLCFACLPIKRACLRYAWRSLPSVSALSRNVGSLWPSMEHDFPQCPSRHTISDRVTENN